jgi:hypothetical protein
MENTASTKLKSSHGNVTCLYHDLAEKLLPWHQAPGGGRMVVGFTTTYAIDTYHH